MAHADEQAIRQGVRDIAQRMVKAEENFLDTLMTFGGITRPEAERALAYYRKAKIVKMDAVGGRMGVTHGAYLDADVIRRAVTAPLPAPRGKGKRGPDDAEDAAPPPHEPATHWEDLDDFDGLVRDAQRRGDPKLYRDLWEAAGRGDTESLIVMLDFLGYPTEGVEAVEVIEKPDDMLGAYLVGRVRVRDADAQADHATEGSERGVTTAALLAYTTVGVGSLALGLACNHAAPEGIPWLPAQPLPSSALAIVSAVVAGGAHLGHMPRTRNAALVVGVGQLGATITSRALSKAHVQA